MPRMVVLTGGGIKGAVAAARSAEDHELILVHADYGQPSAAAEVKALDALAATFQSASLLTVELPHVAQIKRWVTARRRSSPVAVESEEVPKVPPADATRGLMPALLSVGVQCAMRVGASTVALGLSRLCDAGHVGLPSMEGASDGRRELVYAFNLMLEAIVPRRAKVRVEAPLMDLTYAQMVKLGQRFEVPLERTWTCEQRGPRPCERCGPCMTRARAFVETAMVDPLSATSSASV